MAKSLDYCPAKRLKTTHEQSCSSTFEFLSGELIFNLFEYFNTKEIFESFSNLTPFLTSCIFDRHRQLHLYVDHEMNYLGENYSPDQVISVYMNNVIIPIGIFHNLKSLSFVYRNNRKDECLQMINEIINLSQLINVKVLLSRYADVPWIGHRIVDIALCHSSIQRIILLRNSDLQFYSKRKNSRIKLIFPYQKVFIPDDPLPNEENDPRRFIIQDRRIPLDLTRQYDVRHLNLQFQCWRLQSLVKLLSAMPLLITLKVKGYSCCTEVHGWLHIDVWHEMMYKLNALQRVDIDICLAIPFSSREKSAAEFNKLGAQKIETCKRINLTAGRRTKNPGAGCVQINASYNID